MPEATSTSRIQFDPRTTTQEDISEVRSLAAEYLLRARQHADSDMSSTSAVAQSGSSGALEDPGFKIFSTIRWDTALLAEGDRFYLLPLHRDRLLRAAKEFNWPAQVAMLERSDATSRLATLLDAVVANHTAQTTYQTSQQRPDQPTQGPLRIRLLLSSSGRITGECMPTPPLPAPQCLFPDGLSLSAQPDVPRWRVFVAPQAVTPGPHTRHKTTRREHYDALWPWPVLPPGSCSNNSPQRPPCVEIMLQNPAGELMEGSIATPYFARPGAGGAAPAGEGSGAADPATTRITSGTTDTGSAPSRWVTPPAASGGNLGTTRSLALERGWAVEQVVRADSLVIGETVWLSNGVRGFMQATVRPWEELVEELAALRVA